MSNQDHPNPSIWWKHRRRMAYISLAWIIIQTPIWALVAIFSPGAVLALSPVIGWSYGAPMAVLLGYFGNTLAEELVRRKNDY